MSFIDRKRYVLDQLQASGKVWVKDVVKKFGVSEITIRRDFEELEKKGLLGRIHGGAILPETTRDIFTFENKASRNPEKKEKICKAASSFIKDNDVIFMDCGSTLTRLAEHLKHLKNLRIITNSLPAVSALIKYPNLKVNLIGGEIDAERKAVHGNIAQDNIKAYHATKAFIGVDGISLKNGLSSFSEKEASISKHMASNADEVFLLCDSGKFEKDSYLKFAPLSLVNCIITDDGLSEDLLEKYKGEGINIITT